MKLTGATDLARMQVLQQRALDTRQALDKAAVELTTGEQSSRFKATGRNLTRLFALERSLDRNAVFSETLSLTEVRLDIMQAGMGQILGPLENVAIDLATSVGIGDIAASNTHATTARRHFADTVGILNGQVAGQSLYAGTATDGPALAQADAMLAQLDALVAGAATAADVVAAIDGYFAAPAGGFFTTGFVGSPDNLSPAEVGENQRIDYAMRADAAEMVDALRGLALAAVVPGGALAGNDAERMALLGVAGERMIAAKEGVLDVRSKIGVAQEAVELARASRVSERDTLSLARAKLVAIDPLEAASTYQQLEIQLEQVFTVTSRIANLSFLNFMR